MFFYESEQISFAFIHEIQSTRTFKDNRCEYNLIKGSDIQTEVRPI